jgi:hydroxysqualene synthase
MTLIATLVLWLASIPLLLGLVNAVLLRTPRARPAGPGVRVSILIPARDEAANIQAAVTAALATRDVPVEVLVMDDGSTDATAAIVAVIAARDGRVRLLAAPALPSGWAGKAHACQRLAEAATGTHLLFADADVRLEPDAAAALLARAIDRRAAFVSGVPRQAMESWGERLTVPMINLLILGYFPVALMRLFALPGFAAACGQMMLVERDAYFAAGGHAAVRATRHDGMRLVRRMRAAGFRTDLVDGARLATCRMYRDFDEAWTGFRRNATEGMATPRGIAVWTVLLAGGHVLPPLLVLGALGGAVPAAPAVGALAASLAVRMLATLKGRESLWTIPLHPVAVAVALAIQWDARIRAWRGRGEGWRGRDLNGTGTGPLPATKTAADEDFPVASRLLAPARRGPVMAYYRFVRLADDVADDPALAPHEKLARLDALEAALDAGDPAVPEAAALAAVQRTHGCGAAEARDMLAAFRHDATTPRCADWDALMRYCALSAAPAGRFLLRLHGEDTLAQAPADALCAALQILNHLSDIDADRAGLGRVYLPVAWMDHAGGEAAVFGTDGAQHRRALIDAALDRVDHLLDAAEALPGAVRDRRLAAQAAATVAVARGHARRLRAADPLAGRIRPGARDVAKGLAAGIVAGIVRGGRSDARVTAAVVARSGSSFRRGMAVLPAERRRAMYAVYAFCRVVDDLADARIPATERLAALADWRRRIATPAPHPLSPVERELAWAVERFDLPIAELHAVLDGMETDGADRVRVADDAAFDQYCRRVAGAVGVLSVRVFGAPEADAFALSLGRTLQIVNVLRDVDADAAMDRVYVPLSRIGADGSAADLLARPAFADACDRLAQSAAAGFAAADRELRDLDRAKLRPAILMMAAYRRLFARMAERGWSDRRATRLTLRDKVAIAVGAAQTRRAFGRGA